MLTAVIALAVFNTGCTAKMRKAYHEKRADKFYAAGKLGAAEIEYQNVLHAVPGDARTIGRLGLIYFQEGRLQTAAPYLRRGSDLATNDVELRLKLGLIYAAIGKLNEARDAANFVLDRQPQNTEAPLLLIQAAANSPKEIAAARARLQKMAAAGDRAALEVALGTLNFNEHDYKNADTSFRRALSLDPKFSQAYAALGALYAMENDLTNADLNFKAAADSAPDRSPLKVVYAHFKIGTGDAAGGYKILDDMVSRTPDYVPALIGLAGIAYSEKKYDESQSFVDKTLARDPDNFDGLMQDIQLKVVQNNLPAATAELERMTRVYPQAPSVYYQLARVYLMANDASKATTSLNRALDIDPNFTDGILLLAQIQIRAQNPDPAIFALEKLVQKQPQFVQAQLLLADAYRQRNRVDDATAIYASLEKAFPKSPQIPLLAGEAYLQQKDNASARREFNLALQADPANLSALEQLVDLDLAEKQFATALQRIQNRLQAEPDEVGLQVLKAKVALAEGNREEAEAILQKATQINPQNANLYLMLGQLYVEAKQNDKALAQFGLALKTDPNNISALMSQAAIYGTENEYKKQADVYEAVLVIDPKFSAALNNLACLYSQNIINLDRAYDLAQRARALLPSDPNTADTLGWIYFLRGSYPTALGLLQESTAKLPDQPENQFHLGMVNYMMGNEAAARAAFERALQVDPIFAESAECKTCLAILNINPQAADAAAIAVLEKRIAEKAGDVVALGRLAAAYQHSGNSGKTVSTYETILKVDPNNLAALLNLAQLYAPQDAAKAYDTARSAYKLAPDNPVAAHIYGRLAYQNGDFKLANTLLQQTVQNQTGDPQAFFELGQAAYSLGNISAAQSALQKALQLNLPAPQSAQAKQMFDLINLAADPVQAVAATAHVSEILKADPTNVPALMAAGVIDEHNANVSAAEIAYEKVLSRFPDFSPAQRELAILYAKDPTKLAQAADLASKARAIYPDDPALAKASGIIIFQQGDFSRAASQLKNAAGVLPDDPEVFYYLGAAQFKLKDNTHSKASLQNALALKLSGPAADDVRQMLAQLK